MFLTASMGVLSNASFRPPARWKRQSAVAKALCPDALGPVEVKVLTVVQLGSRLVRRSRLTEIWDPSSVRLKRRGEVPSGSLAVIDVQCGDWLHVWPSLS
jgi:hypothetical protein